MKKLIPPPPDSTPEIIDVIYQYYNPVVPPKLQKDADVNLTRLFQDVLKINGVNLSQKKLKEIANHIRPVIIELKNYFNAPRPSIVAQKLGLQFRGDNLTTAQTPSYPSGHAAQAYYLAYVLSDYFPELQSPLFSTAEIVSQSRIDRGVHFPSDIAGGKLLAKLLYTGLVG